MTNYQKSILTQLAASGAEQLHLSRFIAGVIYALEEYERLTIISPKRLQTDQFFSEELQNLLNSIESTLPPPNWLRGFFYNAAIMRLDAVWERTLRIILIDDRFEVDGSDLYERVFVNQKYYGSIFHHMRTEVNHLKHRFGGLPNAVRENPTVLRDGLTELLSLVKQRLI